jgi:hypothetical protein
VDLAIKFYHKGVWVVFVGWLQTVPNLQTPHYGIRGGSHGYGGAGHCIEYTHEGPSFTMKMKVPLVFEKLESQLEANSVFWTEREKFIADLNTFGAAVISFRTRYYEFDC